MMDKQKQNCILPILNITMIIFILFIIFDSQKYTSLLCHDYFYPFNEYIQGRVFSKTFCIILNNILPNMLNINPNDFRSGFSIGCCFLCFLSLIITVLFSLSFFISNHKISDILHKKEWLLILPISYIFINFPLNAINTYYRNYFKMEDLAYTSDYFIVYIFFFSFIILLQRIMFHEYNPKSYVSKTFCVLLSFLLGMHNELFSITALFFLLIFSTIIFCLDKKLLLNRNLLLLIIPFLFGMCTYYIFTNNFEIIIHHYGTSLSTTIQNGIISAKAFISQFYITMFKQKAIFYYVYFGLILLLCLKRDKQANYTIYFSLSILIGYLLSNFSTIFVVGIYQNENYFMFQRDHFEIIYTNIIEFCILILLGKLYEVTKIKTMFIFVIFTFLIFLTIAFSIQYKKIQQLKFNIKTVVYNIDKYNLVYSTLGESSILPADFILPDHTGIGIFHLENNFYYKNEENLRSRKCINSKYFNKDYFGYKDYFNNIYDTEFIGTIFKDNKTAKNEVEKRLELFDDKLETIEHLKKTNINFTNMHSKYKNKKITLDAIQEIEIKKGPSPILDKARAYIFYKNEEYDTSITLYEQYLKTNTNDIDSLLNLARMYYKTGKYKMSEEKYIKLLEIDKENLIFLFELLEIYFYKTNDYDEALAICNKMLNVIDNMPALYINKAIVYSKMGNTKEAENQIEIANKLNPVFTKTKLNELEVTELSNLKNAELIIPIY